MDFKLTTKSGINLVGKIFQPAGKVKKIILLIHGVGEHFGRYSDWADRFTQKGIAVIGVDLPGHGRSPGRRGHIKSYHQYNSIIDSLAQYAADKFGDVSMGIYGHSLGGNIVLNYLLTNGYGFDFAIITSPWIKLGSEPPAAVMIMARFINLFLPGLQQSNGLKLEQISSNSEVAEKYSKDPLVHDRISVRLAVEATKAAERILDRGDCIDIPVLLLHGSDDLITSPGGSRQFAEANQHVLFKLWDKGYHELHNEPFNSEVFDYIYKWNEKLN